MKKLTALVLALILAFGTLTVATATETTDVQTEVSNVLHFDANTTGWNNFKKVFCHIWEYEGDSFYAWQAKAEACTDADGDGVWTYNLDSKNVSLYDGALYGVIFSNENGMQTYNLLFDTTVLGDSASCDGTMYENPEDSSKTAQAAFWRNQDPKEFGPEMCITSIGNVVGTCKPYDISAQFMFEVFLINNLVNARIYSGKEDQQLLDDLGSALGLNKADVLEAICNTSVAVEWVTRNSYLPEAPLEEATPDQPIPPEDCVIPDDEPYYPDVPEYPMTQGNVLHFDTNSASWNNFRKVYCHIWEYGGDSFYAWQSKAEACTDSDGDGVWTYNLDSKKISLEDGTLYGVIFSNENGMQTYNLLFDTTVLGDTACCNDTYYESPEDSSKKVHIAFWSNQNAKKFGPEKQVTSLGNVVGTCIPRTTTEVEMLVGFLEYKLVNAQIYSGKSDQELVDGIGKELNLTKQGVVVAIRSAEVYVDWDFYKSPLVDKNYISDYLIGDADGDGELSVLDASLIQMYLVGKKDLIGIALKAADADLDGEVSVMDASLIQMILVGKK